MDRYYTMEKEHTCDTKSQDTLYRIGMFANMNHITIKALRYYDEQDLLKPAVVDEENGYRYYILSQMADLHQILALRNMGFSISEIKQIQHGTSEKELLLAKKAQLLKEVAAVTARLAEVESYLATENDEKNASHILIKTLPEVIVASSQVRIESYDDLFSLMPQMGQEMERLGCECAMPEYCFTHYLEPGYKDEEILIETCEAVTKIGGDSDLVKFQTFPEVPTAACIFHKGPYSDFPTTYAKVLGVIEKNGYEICGNIREVYIDGIWNKDDESQWLSEIQIPVQKKKQG